MDWFCRLWIEDEKRFIYFTCAKGLEEPYKTYAKKRPWLIEYETHIKDKYRRCIFEGDIVRVQNSLFYRVVYVVSEASFMYEDINTGKHAPIKNSWNDYYKVIGNVKENPDLLERLKNETLDKN